MLPHGGTLHFLLQRSGAWHDEDAAGPRPGAPVSRLCAAADALRLLAADAAPDACAVTLWESHAAPTQPAQRASRGASRAADVCPISGVTAWPALLRAVDDLADEVGDVALPTLATALRRAALVARSRRPTDADVTLDPHAAVVVLLCDTSPPGEPGELAAAAAAVRAAGATLHVLSIAPSGTSSKNEALDALAPLTRCGGRDCLPPLPCAACGFCLPEADSADSDQYDDLSLYDATPTRLRVDPAAPERSACELLHAADVVRRDVASLYDAWIRLFNSAEAGDDDPPPPLPFPLPLPLWLAARDARLGGRPPAEAAPAPDAPPAVPTLGVKAAVALAGCAGDAAAGEAVLQFVRTAGAMPRMPQRTECVRVLLPAAAVSGAAPAKRGAVVAVNLAVDALSRVAATLSRPLCTVRCARLLPCFGAAPGALRGSCRLAPDGAPRGHRPRLALWLRAGGGLELLLETRRSRAQAGPSPLFGSFGDAGIDDAAQRAGAAAQRLFGSAAVPRGDGVVRELLAVVPPPNSSSDRGSRSASCSVRLLPGDASGRAFVLEAGAGAGMQRRFFWLRAADRAAGLAELAALDAALRSPPALSTAAGVDEEHLALMAAAAPTLLLHAAVAQAASEAPPPPPPRPKPTRRAAIITTTSPQAPPISMATTPPMPAAPMPTPPTTAAPMPTGSAPQPQTPPPSQPMPQRAASPPPPPRGAVTVGNLHERLRAAQSSGPDAHRQ